MKLKILRDVNVQPNNKILGGNNLIKDSVMDFDDVVGQKLLDAGIGELVEPAKETKVEDEIQTKVVENIETKDKPKKRKPRAKKKKD